MVNKNINLFGKITLEFSFSAGVEEKDAQDAISLLNAAAINAYCILGSQRGLIMGSQLDIIKIHLNLASYEDRNRLKDNSLLQAEFSMVYRPLAGYNVMVDRIEVKASWFVGRLDSIKVSVVDGADYADKIKIPRIADCGYIAIDAINSEELGRALFKALQAGCNYWIKRMSAESTGEGPLNRINKIKI
jgi:hypothetical protein